MLLYVEDQATVAIQSLKNRNLQGSDWKAGIYNSRLEARNMTVAKPAPSCLPREE